MKKIVISEEQWQQLHARLISQFPLHGAPSPHAPDHWERVERYGILLCSQTRADLQVVRLFALFHDCRRLNDCIDPEHGLRGAELACRLCGEVFELEPRRLKKLVQACRGHNHGSTSPDPTAGACWDADRLDLDRIGITTEPHYMSTDPGRRLAAMLPCQRRKLAGITV